MVLVLIFLLNIAEELYGLLSWETNRLNLKASLEALSRPDDERMGEEIVKVSAGFVIFTSN
jgi:hypothetical protein